jgi:hypothetical protein
LNIDHDCIGVFDCRDGGNVDILDRGAISGVNSYAGFYGQQIDLEI